jgi:hypothetical protein
MSSRFRLQNEAQVQALSTELIKKFLPFVEDDSDDFQQSMKFVWANFKSVFVLGFFFEMKNKNQFYLGTIDF